MVYTVQNAFGEVYGKFLLPESELTCEEWAGRLGLALADILGINGVANGELVLDSTTGESVERVTIDIEPVYGQEQARLERVHNTVEIIARSSLEGQIE